MEKRTHPGAGFDAEDEVSFLSRTRDSFLEQAGDSFIGLFGDGDSFVGAETSGTTKDESLVVDKLQVSHHTHVHRASVVL